MLFLNIFVLKFLFILFIIFGIFYNMAESEITLPEFHDIF